MRLRRLKMLLPALLLCIPLTGCDLPAFMENSESSAPVSDHREKRFDTAAMKADAEAFGRMWNEPQRDTEIQDRIDAMLTSVDEAYAAHIRAQISYYSDWDNADLSALYTQTTEDYYTADAIAAWCFTNGFKKSSYPDVFEPYADTASIEYYTVNNLTRVMAYARKDASSRSELIRSYYDLTLDEDTDSGELNCRCAKIYLELLGDMDVSESLYNYYNRDYTAEEASAVYRHVLEKIVPLRNSLAEQLAHAPWDSKPDFDSYGILRKYAPKLAPGIAESAMKLFSERLYTEAKGTGCYDGSFTVNLPNEQTALIYTHLNDTFLDFITVTHEFGHFHSDWRDRTPIYLQSMNFDIAEAQSQGMVTMFLPYYDEIFGADAALYRQMVLYDLLDSVTAGFAVGEFEYRVIQQLDDISPAETAALFERIMDECSVEMELYQVIHLFEQPGYYISYGVSALPALELYETVGSDRAKAYAIYEKLSSCSCMNAESRFREAMKNCGFTDCFEPEALDGLVDMLAEAVSVPANDNE